MQQEKKHRFMVLAAADALLGPFGAKRPPTNGELMEVDMDFFKKKATKKVARKVKPKEKTVRLEDDIVPEPPRPELTHPTVTKVRIRSRGKRGRMAARKAMKG